MDYIKLENGKIIKYKRMRFFEKAIKRLKSNNENAMDIDSEISNIKELVNFFKTYNFKYVTFYGTLLGIIRDNSLIPHDDDADFVLFDEDFNRFFNNIDILINMGFTIVNYDLRHVVSIAKRGEYIDISFIKKEKNSYMIAEIFKYPDVFFDNTIEYAFNNFRVIVPEQYEQVLEYEYGETWKTPIKYKNSFFYALFLWAWSICKSILPNGILLQIQTKIGKKKKKIWEEKYNNYCKKNNISQ